MVALPCPNCGSELALLEQYQRYYCYACGGYAPEGYGDRGAKVCPTCRGVLSYVPQYDRYYCFRCSAYPEDDAALTSWEPPAELPSEGSTTAETAVVLEESAKASETAPMTIEVPSQPSPEPESRAEEELPLEDGTPDRARPRLVRDEILQAKKPTLMDLCKAHDLDPTGTKDQLRERLLSYLDTLEAEAKPEESRPEAPQQAVEPTDSAVAVEQAAAVETRGAEPALEASETRNEQPADEGPAEATAPVGESEALDTSQPETVAEAASPSVTAVDSAAQAPLVETAFVDRSRFHPCPTCRRELTYIALYRRWYCYHCRAYAPLTKSKFACPNCGAALRWIEQYERWWCDACRRYASADLPKPELDSTAASAGTAVRPVAQVATFPTTFVHRHRSPGSGIGLVGFGVVLFVLYEVLVDLPAILAFSTGIAVSPDLAFGLRFFAFVFVAAGAIMGLSAVRDRR